MAYTGLSYFRTIQGILKCLETLCCFIGLILISIDGWSSALFNAYIVGTTVGLIIALVLIVINLTKLGNTLEGVLAYQIYYLLVWFVYLVVVSSIIVARHSLDRYTAAGSFGLIVSGAYIVDAVDCYRNDPTPLFFLRR